MTPTFQTDIDDCWPACLATIFDVPLSEVEHLRAKDLSFREATQQWLAKRGLFFIEIEADRTPTGGVRLPFLGGVDGILCIMAHGSNIAMHAAVVKMSITSEGRAAFELAHDPWPKGIVPPSRTFRIVFFCKIITR